MAGESPELVQPVSARSLIDRAFDRQLFVLDLEEDFQYLEVEIPRFSTWYIPGKNIAPELVVLNQALKAESKVIRPLTEELTKSDLAEVKRLIKAEIEKADKDRKTKDLTFVRNVLTSFVKSLYAKRSSWTNDLSGDKSS